MHNNINGSYGGRGGFLQSVDFYRRMPRDLTEATSLGAIMSLICMATMVILFLCETLAFARSDFATSVIMDQNPFDQIRLNFNITLPDLQCDYVVVDVWDSLGTNRQNVTKNVEKWQLDADGVRRIFSGRNREVRELVHEEHDESHEELIKQDGQAVTELTPDNFRKFLKSNPSAFIDFYAPWCIWCQKLHPTWEKYARDVEDEGVPVGVGMVNCEENRAFCMANRISSFPCLRWYQDGEPVFPDYKQDRTVDAIMQFTKRKLELTDRVKSLDGKSRGDNEKAARARDLMRGRPENPGCQVSGHLMVNRVPGNFHIEARSKNHNLNAPMTNLTHIVNHLSFGEPNLSRMMKRTLKNAPNEHKNFSPIDGRSFTTREPHQAFHHYIKVVTTYFKFGTFVLKYQLLEQDQIVRYDDFDVPEARFSYDISPMGVLVEYSSRKWYDYLTSLCAIIGGTFTTLGLVDSLFFKVLKSKKIS